MNASIKRSISKLQPWLFSAALLFCAPGCEQTKSPSPEPSAIPMEAEQASPAPSPSPRLPARELTQYDARLTVDHRARSLSGRLYIRYVNPGDDVLYGLRFHLYPNSIEPGIMTVNEAAVNGISAEFTQENDLLSLPLAIELNRGDTCSAYISYTLDFSGPAYCTRYGGGFTLPLPLPVSAVNSNGWLPDAPYGSENYTPPGEYRIILASSQDDIEITDSNLTVGEDGLLYSPSATDCTLTFRPL